MLVLECPCPLSVCFGDTTMKRRDFLSMTTLAAGAAAFTPLTGITQTTPPTTLSSPIEPVWVPLTKEVKTTLIGFGTGMRGGNRRADLTRMGYPKAIELLRHAYDRGIRLFDCADMYGTHDVVAEALRGKPRDSYVLVTKVWMRPGGIPETERLPPEESIKRFLREMRTDYIDVVQIHCMDNNQWTQQFADSMESLDKAKKAGLIRAHGISSHSNAATELAAETEWCDVVHVRINSEGIQMDGPRDDAAARVAEAVRTAKKNHDAGKGVIAMKVLGQGDGGMPNDPEMRKKSTKFLMDLGCINVMIIGFTEKEHITEFVTNVAALS